MKTIVATAIACLLFTPTMSAENWPQWRGPQMNGVSGEKDLPVHWSPTENVDWKVDLPAWSGATPIVWRDYVFLHVPDGRATSLWCLDRGTKTIRWKKGVTPNTEEGRLHVPEGESHMLAWTKQQETYSSPSPVTDGQHVWVLSGTGVLKAFDFAGNEIWMRDIQTDYGSFGLNYGYHSSPLLDGDAIYVQVVHGFRPAGPSYVLRIDKNTGKTVWKVERANPDVKGESQDSYRTPVMLRFNGQQQVVVGGADMVNGYDATTGQEVWRGRGLNSPRSAVGNTVANPVVFDGIIYAPRLQAQGPFTAFRAGGTGDISESHKLFSFNGPLVPSPVTDGTYLYTVSDSGILSCWDAKTGTAVYPPQRVRPGTVTSSLVLADGKLYITNEEATTSVVKAGPVFELLGQNMLADYTISSMAVSEGQLFIRTNAALYVIGKRAGH